MESMYIIGGVVAAAGIYTISVYNTVIQKKEAVITDEKAIGIQLDERNKLFDSMINTVKKYMEHENGVLTEIVKLRNAAQSPNREVAHQAEQDLSDMISSGRLASGLNVTMEAYPDLKANENMLKLQETIESIERRLANAKRAFNGSVEDYNAYVQSFPANIVVGIFSSSLKHNFLRWELSKEKIEAAEERVVSF